MPRTRFLHPLPIAVNSPHRGGTAEPCREAQLNGVSFVRGAAASTRPADGAEPGRGSISFNMALATSSGGAWLRTSATGGTIGAFASTTINVIADPGTLASVFTAAASR